MLRAIPRVEPGQRRRRRKPAHHAAQPRRARTRRRFAELTLALLIAGCGPKPATEQAAIHAPTSQPSTARVVEFHPGLRIDYRVPQVEIDAEVVLREGALELFAYAKAPVPKEHESILRTSVPVEKVFQALGLIGLTPGQPPRYLLETKATRPASGDAVDVRVRLDRGGRSVEESACDWMWNVASKGTMARTHWLFCGSEQSPDGRLAAQEEGTLVTVVDFPSSLLSLPTPHTDKDAELWLKAHTPAIPEVGTRVTLILRPARR